MNSRPFQQYLRRFAFLVLMSVMLAAAYFTGKFRNGAEGRPGSNEGPTSALVSSGPASAPVSEMSHAEEEPKATIWTCSMHPQIRLPKPGKCPICGMTLIPLDEGAGDEESRVLVMSPADRKLAEIETTPVERRFADAEIRMVGLVEYDETRIKAITAWVPGRIDRLYVDYTGVTVNQGDHLVELYSPELLTAQAELISAKKRAESGASERSDFLRESDIRGLESVRRKLSLWGLDASQIQAIESGGEPETNVVIKSPISGVVIHRALNEGQYVATGTPIYTVADLKKVWVKLDAYESDLPWLHYGQKVTFETEAYPGMQFDGIIAFIDPVLETRTRTVKVRVNVDNTDGRLKPGMFLRATVHSRVASGGRVMDPGISGKWIAPMHPEIVRDNPGECPICGMDLVKAEAMGYVRADDVEAMPLVVPASAVLKTGERAVVYVEKPGTEKPTYEGREVKLGPRAGDVYLIESGLTEGERVVVNGSFNIDSALQIRAQPSVMSEPGGAPAASGHHH